MLIDNMFSLMRTYEPTNIDLFETCCKLNLQKYFRVGFFENKAGEVLRLLPPNDYFCTINHHPFLLWQT